MLRLQHVVYLSTKYSISYHTSGDSYWYLGILDIPAFRLDSLLGRASLCTDSAQCRRQEVFGVENNIK